MLNKKVIIYTIIAAVIVVLLVAGFFAYRNLNPKLDVNPHLTPDQIMQIAKTDKDYNDLLDFTKNFNPEIITYIELSPNDYKKMKLDWEKQGLTERTNLIDKLTLTNSTYWIELKNKNDETKGLRLVLDTKENKSLLLIASLSVSAGVGL